MIVTLAGKDYRLKEPCFRDLKIILKAFSDIKPASLQSILDVFTLESVPLKTVRENELEPFFEAVKQLCNLTASEPTKKGSGSIDWGGLYAHLSATFGWTYDEIDATMTISRLEEYKDYMDRNPPVHQLAAWRFGYEYKEQESGNAFLRQCAKRANLGETNE